MATLNISYAPSENGHHASITLTVMDGNNLVSQQEYYFDLSQLSAQLTPNVPDAAILHMGNNTVSLNDNDYDSVTLSNQLVGDMYATVSTMIGNLIGPF